MQPPIPLGQNPVLPLPASLQLNGVAPTIAANHNAGIAAGITLFSGLGLGFTAVEASRQIPVIGPRVYRTLLLVLSGAQPIAQSLVVVARKNGVDTGLLITIAPSSPAGLYRIVFPVQFQDGDLVGVRATQDAGANPSGVINSWALSGD